MEKTKRYCPKLASKEMFKYRTHITNAMELRGKTPEGKRRIIEAANGELFYIFGNKLVSKPWLSYEEQL